jgi:thiosulfate/3-mercaptopyruvate sulfurtransferase
MGEPHLVDAQLRVRQRRGARWRVSKWSREGRPVEIGVARARPPATFVVQADRKLMVGKEAVLAAIEDSTICTINALSREQHTGTGGTVYGRAGRIAKSVNVPAAALLDPATGVYLPAPELRAKLAAVGAFDKPQVITYCGGGIAASSDALVLTMLGHPDVRLYDGSMSEWSNDQSLPMETG